jgi:hypothetical protein
MDRTPTLKFKSSLTPATFKCKVDGGAFKASSRLDALARLSLGQHTFKVPATHGGATDPTPASRTFMVLS